MILRLKQSLGSLGIIAGLGTLLVVLAVLQFKWSNQLSNAEWQQQQATLQAGMNGFREDLHRELAGICSGFASRDFSATDTLEGFYARHCADWVRTSDQRDLVANFYLWEMRKGGGAAFLKFNAQSGEFHAEPCPERLGDLCETASLEIAPPSRGTDFAPPLFGWRLRGDLLAMVHPLYRPVEPVRGTCPPECAYAGVAIVELNREALLKEFLPELAQRYFGGPEGLLYQVAIVDSEKPPRFIYSSEPTPSPLDFNRLRRFHAFVRHPAKARSRSAVRGLPPAGNEHAPRIDFDLLRRGPGGLAGTWPGSRAASSCRFWRMPRRPVGNWWFNIAAAPCGRRWPPPGGHRLPQGAAAMLNHELPTGRRGIRQNRQEEAAREPGQVPARPPGPLRRGRITGACSFPAPEKSPDRRSRPRLRMRTNTWNRRRRLKSRGFSEL